jgi:propionyl-CoA carboxylase alpha chain
VAHAAAVLVDGEWKEVGTARATETYVDLTVDGVRRRYRVRLAAHGAEVNGPEGQSSFARRTEDDPDEQGGTAGECRAPLPGAIARVLVTTGDLVNDGDPLVVLEAMKMEHTLRAPFAGMVREVSVGIGAQVVEGARIMEIEPAKDPVE